MIDDDVALLETCGAHTTRDHLKSGAYATGYYPAYIRDALQEIGRERLFAAVLASHDAKWAHRMLCLCDPDRGYTDRFIAIIHDFGWASDFWAVLFTHGRSMPCKEFERFAQLLVETGDQQMIYCAAAHVPGFKTFRSALTNH